MNLKNFLMSKAKWEPIVKLLETPGRVDWDEVNVLLGKKCGHCKEDTAMKRAQKGYKDCKECTLNIDKLCFYVRADVNPAPFWLLYFMAWGDIPRNKRKGRSIARRIYAAILKDDSRIKEGGPSDD